MTALRVLENIDALVAWIGREVAVSDWWVIAQSRIQAFADATGDQQWIHVDPERARRESPFGTPVAHGYLLLSLLPAMLDSCLHVESVGVMVNYGLDRVRFTTPVPAGSRIRAHVVLDQLTPCQGGVQAHYAVTIELDGGDKPACVVSQLVRYYG